MLQSCGGGLLVGRWEEGADSEVGVLALLGGLMIPELVLVSWMKKALV